MMIELKTEIANHFLLFDFLVFFCFLPAFDWVSLSGTAVEAFAAY